MKKCKIHKVEYTTEKCPQCCYHGGQVYLKDGPKCSDCDKALVWVTADQLKHVEELIHEHECS